MGLSRHSWNERGELTIPAGCRIWELLVKIPNLSRWNSSPVLFFFFAGLLHDDGNLIDPILVPYQQPTVSVAVTDLPKAFEKTEGSGFILELGVVPESCGWSRHSECHAHFSTEWRVVNWQHGSPGQQQFLAIAVTLIPPTRQLKKVADEGQGGKRKLFRGVLEKAWGLLIFQFCSSDFGRVACLRRGRTIENKRIFPRKHIKKYIYIYILRVWICVYL